MDWLEERVYSIYLVAGEREREREGMLENQRSSV